MNGERRLQMLGLCKKKKHILEKINLQSPTPLPEPLPSRRNRFLQPQHPKQQILQWQQRQKHAIAQIRQTSHNARHQRIHPVMIRRRHNRHENHTGIPQAERNIKCFPPPPFPDLALLERAAEDARVVDHGAADAEGVAEMHAWHCGEGVDEVAGHED